MLVGHEQFTRALSKEAQDKLAQVAESHARVVDEFANFGFIALAPGQRVTANDAKARRRIMRALRSDAG
jgi:hypothetical protein